MALTPEQKSSRLFKKSMGAGETLLTRDFFEEPKLGNANILPDQIWTEAEDIPTTAPVLTNGQTDGVVQYFEKLALVHVPGSTDLAYSSDDLKDTIPFNFTDGSYNYTLYKDDGSTQIFFGEGDWLVDTSAGVLTFYGTLPSGVSSSLPPKISFYKYIGAKGLQVTGATSGLNVKDPVSYATVEELSGATYDAGLSGYTTLPTEVDGVSGFTEGTRILVKNQLDEIENGVFVISGSTLVRAADNDGTPIGEVGINDYVFVLSGSTLLATSWVLSDTDADNPDYITPGVDTQSWSLFSQSLAYQADETGLKLDQQTFYIDLDETGGLGSGLEQGVDGIRVKDSLLTTISGNTSDITELESAVSGNTSDILSLETVISDFEPLSADNAGSGLTFIEASGTTGATLNVNVDDYTVKIVNNELRTPETWMEFDSSTTISGGTSGATNIVLDFDPVGYISAYINGIEYLVSPVFTGTINQPFFFTELPTVNSVLHFDSTKAGFGLESGTDIIQIKYHYIDTVI